MKRIILFAVVLAMVAALAASTAFAATEAQQKYLVPGKVTLIDLGAHKCLPCRMMAPILNQLKAEYKDKAAIVFLDVWQDQTPAKAFGIRVIPTQIFFDADGKEVLRHEGFMDKQSIRDQLTAMGVK